MQHFEREAKWMAAVFVLLLAVGVAAAFVVPYVLTQIEVTAAWTTGAAMTMRRPNATTQ
jgi:hypothetical protein